MTAGAWLDSSEQATQEDHDEAAASSEAVVTVQKRAGYELTQRSFTAHHHREGTSGHMVDEERDRARTDRRFARSTAHLTPALFRDEMERRVYVESTTTIEEVDTAAHQAKKPEKVPLSSPTVEFGSSEVMQAPGSAPQSFGPQTAAKSDEKKVADKAEDV